ncbi:MAG: hypothetical protein J0H84_18705 [Rhizobiales bacterium]|nr:hypothetical protein [Hyphomicrobiales bacterium]
MEKGAGEPDELWRERLRAAVSGNGGPTAVARLSGVPIQTLRNHMGGRTKKAPLEDLRKVADALGLSSSWLMALDRDETTGFAEGDVAPYSGDLPALEEPLAHARGRWRIMSRALDLAGILPGDIVEFDLNDMQPPRGTVVVAQHYRPDRPQADTVLRVYEPPVLLVRTTDAAIDGRPIELGERTVVMGSFRRLYRERRGS